MNKIEELQKRIAELERELKELKKEQEKPTTYKIGMRFKHEDGEDCILARANDGLCVLIGLEGGNRYVSPAEVKYAHKITPEEFAKICGGEPEKFTLIHTP